MGVAWMEVNGLLCLACGAWVALVRRSKQANHPSRQRRPCMLGCMCSEQQQQGDRRHTPRPHIYLVDRLQAKGTRVQHNPSPREQRVVCTAGEQGQSVLPEPDWQAPYAAGHSTAMHDSSTALASRGSAPACAHCRASPRPVCETGSTCLCPAAASAPGWPAGHQPQECRPPAAARLCAPGTPRRPACAGMRCTSSIAAINLVSGGRRQ